MTFLYKFTPSRARQLLDEVWAPSCAVCKGSVQPFADPKSTRDLRKLLLDHHVQAGGDSELTVETPQVVSSVKKALHAMCSEGRLSSPQRSVYVHDLCSCLPRDTPLSTDDKGQPAVTEKATQTTDPCWNLRSGDPRIIELGNGREFVYAVREGDCKTIHKIGCTQSSPEARVSALQTGASRPLTLVCLFRTHDARALEKSMHAALSYQGCRVRSGGEWFRATREDIVRLFLHLSPKSAQ
jgi:hypothetical protein